MMRISTSQIFDAGARNISNSQSALYRTQNQLSKSTRILSPQDDPVGASQVLLDTQAKEVNAQYADNQGNAKSQLGLEEDRLKSVVESVQYIRAQVIASRNATLSDSQRAFFANDLRNQLDFLLGVANSADASGHYLFSGFQGETQPFQTMADGSVQYFGDEGQRLLQVGASRQIAVSDSGSDIFVKNLTGNGSFATAANAANTGTGVISNGSVVNQSAWTGQGYQLQIDPGGTTYSITNTTTSTSVVANKPFVAGAAITDIPGISIAIQGSPAAGDTFTVAPSTNQSIFTTLQNLISAFGTPVEGDATAGAQLQNAFNSGLVNLDQVLDNVLRVQASVGSRMQELTGLQNTAADLNLRYEEKISKIQDLDYAEAISRFMSQNMQLEAAQKSFAQVSQLSLLNYI